MREQVLICHRGFTLIEISIIIVVIGIILFAATGAWNMLVRGRQISATRNVLKSVNNCLLNYAIVAKKIPPKTYFDSQCKKEDIWGQDITYESGNFICDNFTSSQTKTIIDADGNVHKNILWILVSNGPNKRLDVNLHSPDFSKVDDLYLFVSDLEIYANVCQ